MPLDGISEAISPTMEMKNLKTLAFSSTVVSHLAVNQFNAVWGRLVKNSPQLEEMQMWATMEYDPDFLRIIPFSRLTALTLPRVSIYRNSTFVASLAQCRCLRTLSISLDGCAPQPDRPYTLAIPSLTKLDIVGVELSNPAVDNFIQSFHLPSLVSLSIHETHEFAGTTRTQSWDTLKRALDHWKPTLQSLSLRHHAAYTFESARGYRWAQIHGGNDSRYPPTRIIPSTDSPGPTYRICVLRC